MATQNDGLRQYRWFAGVLGLITVSMLLLVATQTTQLFGDETGSSGPSLTQQ
jgi:hypothetical protein